jgi:hypothetical protein
MKILILSTILFSFNSYAQDGYPYNLKESGFVDSSGTTTIISPSTPTKAQDGIGLCYGFSATSLLEHHRCSVNNSSCQNPSDQLSSLDVTSNANPGSIVEGGHSARILSNIQSKLKVAKEECVRFSALVHEYSDSKGFRYSNERGGWKVFADKWREFKGLKQDTPRNDCVTCMADAIKSTLVNIQTPREQIIDAFNTSSTLEQFLYKSLLPSQCLKDNNMATIPPFVARGFPSYKDQLTVDSLSKKVETILLNGLPLEIGICTMLQEEGKCREDQGHSIALFGIKEVCSRSQNICKTMVKVKNSYGQTWQEQNDDGWVDLRSLAESSIALSKHGNINWIEKPGFVLQNKTLSKASTYVSPSVISSPGKISAGVPTEYKNHKGLWKCPGNAFRDSYDVGCVPMGR